MTYVELTERDEAVRATVAAATATREQCVYGPRGEIKALADVQARLEKRFPELQPDVVAAAVRLAQSELDGPVRDFVPVLVEHAARDRLAFAEPAPSATLPPEAENAEAIEPVGPLTKHRLLTSLAGRGTPLGGKRSAGCAGTLGFSPRFVEAPNPASAAEAR